MRTKLSRLWLFVALQLACAIAVVASLAISILGLWSQGLSWQLREILEIAAILGLLLGSYLGAKSIRQARSQQVAAEKALRAASGAFAAHVDTTFQAQGLTKAEHDVAWLIVKGFSIKDTAELRGTYTTKPRAGDGRRKPLPEAEESIARGGAFNALA